MGARDAYLDDSQHHSFQTKTGYGASKHAAESWSNSLRQELRPFGIEVTSVNPSWHDTRIAASPRDHLLGLFDALPPVLQAEYGREYVERVAADAFDGRQGFTWRVRVRVDGWVGGMGAGVGVGCRTIN